MKQRIVTGLIGGAVFLTLLLEGNLLFSIFMVLLSLIGFYELAKMSKNRPFGVETILGYISILVVYAPIFINKIKVENSLLNMIQLGSENIQNVLIGYTLLLLITVVLSKNEITIEKVSILFIGVIYVGYGFYFFNKATLEMQFPFVLSILLMIWATDSGAYFVGRKWGKNKLFPVISPKKTIEGAIGGVVCSFLVAIIMYSTTEAFGDIPFLKVLFMSLIVSVMGQFGDLIESAIKRQFDIKDSGNILPGHGGILDRFDSMIFVFPMLHLLMFI